MQGGGVPLAQQEGFFGVTKKAMAGRLGVGVRPLLFPGPEAVGARPAGHEEQTCQAEERR